MRASDMKVFKQSISDRNFSPYAATRAKYIYGLHDFSSRRILISVNSLLTVFIANSFQYVLHLLKTISTIISRTTK